MSSSGPAESPPREGRARRDVPLWLALAAMAVVLVLAALILVRIARPLYALLFPVSVPVPGGVQEVEHRKPDQGAEYWIYRSTKPGLEIAVFYEQEGGECQYTPRDETLDPLAPGVSYSVAYCVGETKSGGLGLGWEVYIHEGYSAGEGPTIFRIYKYGEVN